MKFALKTLSLLMIAASPAFAEVQVFSIQCAEETGSRIANKFHGSLSAKVEDNKVSAVASFTLKRAGNYPSENLTNLTVEGTTTSVILPGPGGGDQEAIQFKLKGGPIVYASFLAQGNLTAYRSMIRTKDGEYRGKCTVTETPPTK